MCYFRNLKARCEILQLLSKTLVDQDVQQGIQQGEMKGKKENALNLHDMGMNVGFIAKTVNVSVDLG